jgi:tripartite-type tricarboxylate transporter receptor subunit TctC
MTSLLRVFAIGAALLAAESAFAQGHPEQGIKIVVGFPPGVAPDIMAHCSRTRSARLLLAILLDPGRA